MARVAERTETSTAFADLREYIAWIEARGELRRLSGAHWNLEIGVLTEQLARKDGAPAVLFTDVPDSPREYGLLVNALASPRRVAPVLGLPEDSSGIELVNGWRRRLQTLAPLPPVEVPDGPVAENILRGDDIDLLRFPTPQWHEADGGRYIGTAALNIMQDPDEGWVNVGTYRSMIHERNSLLLYISPGKHGRLIRHKYFERGQPCPVAIAVGQDPAVTLSAFYSAQWGVSEYDFAGWLRGAPVEVMRGPTTGLPIPATAELVIEGMMQPGDEQSEGPFGEWTGYYASSTRPEPVVRVTAVLHRDNPIIHGAPPIKPPSEVNFAMGIVKAAGVWQDLEAAGLRGIEGVWQIPAGGVRFLTVVAIKQQYAGHARQVGYVASQGRAGGYLGRYVIVVDDDIDPANLNDVLWAISTRSDPATSIEIMHDCWASALDPRMPPEQRDRGQMTNSRAIIDATRPYHWRDRYPPVSMASKELTEQVLGRWRGRLDL
jgi:UbiD family decarboxylase